MSCKKLIGAITFTFFIICSNIFGQNISGTVLDNKTSFPLEGVNVFIKTYSLGSVSDSEGKFYLKNPNILSDNDSIQFSIIGYRTKYLTYKMLKRSSFKVFMSPIIENLDQVEISADKKLQAKVHFKKLASLKKGVHSFGSSLVNGKIYVIGGDVSYIEEPEKRALNQAQDIGDFLKKMRSNLSWESYTNVLQVYDIDTNSWRINPDINFRKRAYHNSNHLKNYLYVIGGKSLSLNRKKEYLENKIEIFNLEDQTIVVDETYPHQAINFTSFVFKDNLIVMGGSVKLKNNGKKEFTKKSHIYNLETGYWYELEDMLQAKEANGVIIDNTIYLVGGFNGKALSEIESYNITKGKWQKEGHLFERIESPALTTHENVIYFYNYGKVYTLNTISKVLNEYNIGINTIAPSLHFYEEKLYIIGGFFQGEYSKEATTGVYSIDIDEFDNTKIVRSKVVKNIN